MRKTTRALQELPVNPQNNGGKISAAREEGSYTANSTVLPKGTSLNQGYARLFGGEQEVQLTMADRPTGKRQYNPEKEDGPQFL